MTLPFGDFAITIIAADFQLVHAVRMLGEQSLELVNQNPGSRLPDVLVHRRTYAADHPAVTVTATNLCTNLLGLHPCFLAVDGLDRVGQLAQFAAAVEVHTRCISIDPVAHAAAFMLHTEVLNLMSVLLQCLTQLKYVGF